MQVQQRQLGKSWARRQIQDHCVKWGQLTEIRYKDGLRWLHYTVFDKRYVFVDRALQRRESDDQA